jgi:magnesium chelatase subunit I
MALDHIDLPAAPADGASVSPRGRGTEPRRATTRKDASHRPSSGAPAEGLLADARPSFPFTAIVGQDDMKLALLIAAIEPRIGGVLVLGHRGTGKSTTVRALAAVLPSISVVSGCPCNCDPSDGGVRCPACSERLAGGEQVGTSQITVPVVDLPLGATEDRVVGALDIERALVRGEKAFQHGLLARANRGFLYIDEVNLLEDYLVDLLLDVAATGENLVERDGLSLRHPARFVLVGSGNPEEGELRPQLLDRFGLSVSVSSPAEIETRVEIVLRRDAFERDPGPFLATWREEEHRLRRRIEAARRCVGQIAAGRDILEAAARLCMSVGSDGSRGELTVLRAARAVAALDECPEVSVAHIKRVAAMALGHRLRRNPLDESGSSARIERAVAEVLGP